MRKISLIILLIVVSFGIRAQGGYDIKINVKNFRDSTAYLAKYVFDQTYIADTCKKIKNGVVEFKGKTPLDKGIYILVNQDKVFFFEFLVNEGQKFIINVDAKNIGATVTSPNSKENEVLFSYLNYTSKKNVEFDETRLTTAGKSKEDSIRIMKAKITQLEEDVKKFDKQYMEKVKGTFIYDYMNLKTEKYATDVPKASNGRPDSIYQYYYYKSHFFDGVNFKDERICRTPYFDDRVKKYFESVIAQHPDTVITEIDKILGRCDEGNLNYNALLGYFTYKNEQSKVVGFDKVFLHLVDNYILAGKAKTLYPGEETLKLFGERSKIMNPLLEGKKVPDLYMIDTLNAPAVKKMGFDTAHSVKSITDLYYKNERKLANLFVRLHDVEAKYTILVFWAADCGHCQKEIPKLSENMKELKGKVDAKIFAVQTKDDQYTQWKKFLIDNKIADFINVYDPVHLNNVKEKFDVNSTPLIYVLDKDKKIITKKIASEYVVELIKNLEKQSSETGKKP